MLPVVSAFPFFRAMIPNTSTGYTLVRLKYLFIAVQNRLIQILVQFSFVNVITYT